MTRREKISGLETKKSPLRREKVRFLTQNDTSGVHEPVITRHVERQSVHGGTEPLRACKEEDVIRGRPPPGSQRSCSKQKPRHLLGYHYLGGGGIWREVPTCSMGGTSTKKPNRFSKGSRFGTGGAKIFNGGRTKKQRG